MIARGAMLGAYQPVILHKLDIEPNAETLKGIKMELMDAAFRLLRVTLIVGEIDRGTILIMHVLVIANPANTNALILKEFAPLIPEDNITSLSRLDHNHASNQISENLNVHGTWVLMGVYSDGSYSIQPGLIYSFPVTCEKGEWPIVQGLKIDEFEREKMDVLERELIEEKTVLELALKNFEHYIGSTYDSGN
ncbi:hypothetical protein L1987_79471 [Smallanthus sonchifolius]|uniref:Uncharacterized protein n=1 Tax=Smallanthus sonchifolius TaxID=185202 RepID=A0ACB8ZFK3_9ASTR|nr:hypothetical protein L1987_79471 [Smallanthus sonchifolius]